MIPGQTYYLKRADTYRACTLIKTDTLISGVNTIPIARVKYYADGEVFICQQAELLTDEQYKAVLAQRRKEAYERDRPARLMEARIKYAQLITLWEKGCRTPADFIKATNTGTLLYWGGQIAAAKRWELITDDPKPSNPNCGESG